MRWKAKPKNKVGDKRIIEQFLLIPIKISDEWRWLEKAKIEQELKETYVYDYNMIHRDRFWDDIKFID